MRLIDRLITRFVEEGYEIRLTSDFSGAIDFGKFREAEGLVKGFVFPDDLLILINKDLPVADRVQTLIHELLHELYPKWGETRIENATQEVYRELGQRDQLVLKQLVTGG